VWQLTPTHSSGGCLPSAPLSHRSSHRTQLRMVDGMRWTLSLGMVDGMSWTLSLGRAPRGHRTSALLTAASVLLPQQERKTSVSQVKRLTKKWDRKAQGTPRGEPLQESATIVGGAGGLALAEPWPLVTSLGEPHPLGGVACPPQWRHGRRSRSGAGGGAEPWSRSSGSPGCFRAARVAWCSHPGPAASLPSCRCSS
jgi:hypothetical protein